MSQRTVSLSVGPNVQTHLELRDAVTDQMFGCYPSLVVEAGELMNVWIYPRVYQQVCGAGP